MTSALQLPLSLYLPMIFRICCLFIFKIDQCWKNWELLSLLVLVLGVVLSATRRQRAHSLSRAEATPIICGERQQAAAVVVAALVSSIIEIMAWGVQEPTTPVVKTAVAVPRYLRRMYLLGATRPSKESPRLLRPLLPRNLRLPPGLRHHYCSCHRLSRFLTQEAGKVVKAAMTKVEAAAEVAGESR